MFAEYIDWRAKHPSDDLMTRLLNAEFEDEHGETAHADPPGGAHVHRGDRRRRQRDDGTAHRLAGQAARRAPRPTSRGRQGSLARPQGDRGNAAVRTDGARHRTCRHARRRVLRHDGARGQRHAAARSARRTATPPLRAIPTCSTSTARMSRHLTFGWGVHYCLGATSPASRGGSRSTSSSTASPSGTSTTTASSWRRRRPCAAGSTCRSSDPVTLSASEPVVVVSNDTHIGPRLVEDLRDVLPVEVPRRVRSLRRRDGNRSRGCGHDARGQRVPRPSELPHRRATTTRPLDSPTTTTTASRPASSSTDR